MTRRLWMIIALGAVAVLVSGALALDERRPVRQPQVSPSWGLYTEPQWHTLQARYGPIRMATSAPPLAIVAARGCLFVLHGMKYLGTACRPAAPLQLYSWRSAGTTNVVGITSPAVSYVTVSGRYSGRIITSGLFLMQAPHGHVFGSGTRVASTFTAYGAHGRVLGRLYCASALRGVCGTSAQRRS